MHERHIVAGVFAGLAALALGLMPGLISGISEGIRNLHDLMSPNAPRAPREEPWRKPAERLDGQVWFAAGGIVLLLLTFLDYYYSR
ncbi:MAG: hypothetical protein M3Z85_19190 [Acidobacteriota bacterium]|nr:hypothetical protein [Acidobacteriota bacterium]